MSTNKTRSTPAARGRWSTYIPSSEWSPTWATKARNTVDELQIMPAPSITHLRSGSDNARCVSALWTPLDTTDTHTQSKIDTRDRSSGSGI